MRRGLSSLFCFAATFCLFGGVVEFVYDRPDRSPVVFSAECRAENAMAAECCLWLDVIYDDGSAVWGTGDAQVQCRQGTHDWERVVGVFRPENPVKRISFHTLFRGAPTGKAEFRNVVLERREPRKDEICRKELSDFPRTIPCGGRHLGPAAVPSGKNAVWIADSMRRVTPLDYPTTEEVRSPEIALELMRNESESVQLNLTAAEDVDLRDVDLRLPRLMRSDGQTFAGSLKWERVGYIPRRTGYLPHPLGVDPAWKWLPDPLLPSKPFRVRPASTQGTWLTVRALPETEPGVYSGTVEVVRGKELLHSVRIRVEVAEAVLPSRFATRNSFSVLDGFTRSAYPDRFRQMKRESWSVLLDHRMSPDDISRFKTPNSDDIEYACDRGMNGFNVLNVVPEPADPMTPVVYTAEAGILASNEFYRSFLARLRPVVADVKRHGHMNLAYVYGFDERGSEYYPVMREFRRRLRRDIPGIHLLSTSRAYRDLAIGENGLTGPVDVCDWFCPLLSDWRPEISDSLRRQGKEVWWYVSGIPDYPYANFASIEHPLIEARILGWMTHLYGVDGFLYWAVNFWEQSNGLLKTDDTYLDWDSTIDNHHHGDGVLIYPGADHILPSIRLAAIRDGIEDGELLRTLPKSESDGVCRQIIRSLTDFTRDPAVLRSVRRRILCR